MISVVIGVYKFVQESLVIFWNTTVIWQVLRVILNFTHECYYLKNKVGLVDFTKPRILVKFPSPQALQALEL